MKDLIRHLATDEPQAVGVYDTRMVRVKNLRESFEQDGVINALEKYNHYPSKYVDIGREKVVKAIRNEIEILGNSQQGLPSFDSTKPDMELGKLQSCIKENAPMLCALLYDLMKSTKANETKKDYMGPITMISSIIAYARAPRIYNQFPVLLGTYLHAMGVKRRVIAVLSGLGIIPTYQTISRKYDEYRESGKVIILSGMTQVMCTDSSTDHFCL